MLSSWLDICKETVLSGYANGKLSRYAVSGLPRGIIDVKNFLFIVINIYQLVRRLECYEKENFHITFLSMILSLSRIFSSCSLNFLFCTR